MSYTPAKVVAVFLAQFDTKKGYTMVWQKSRDPDLNMDGLDYKALPSGIHDFKQTTVVVSAAKKTGGFYYGVARFKQLIIGDDASNRDNVLMYLLGVVCDPHPSQWRPNQFVEVGWEYVNELDDAVSKFEATNDHAILGKLYDKLTGLALPGQLTQVAKSAAQHHLLSQLPNFITKVGPLVFPLVKQALLRQRILFFNNDNHHAGNDYYSIYAYDYLLSMLSVVPNDINAAGRPVSDYYSTPIYNVGLVDEFWHLPGYIGTTNDDILMYNKHASDVEVMLNGAEPAQVFLTAEVSTNQLGPPHRALRRDRRRLRRLLSTLEPAEQSVSCTDDMRLIHSLVSSYDDDDLWRVHGKFPCHDMTEPTWWQLEACQPMLWRELLWLAWSWFALAGSVEEEEELPMGDTPVDFLLLVTVVGYFHGLTRRYFALINELVEEQRHGDGKVDIEVTYQDLVDMDLDPYSSDDHEFIRKFVLKYYADDVNEVEVGMGLASICC